MTIVEYDNYTLMLGHNPCDIFTHYGVEELHGLSLKDCQQHENTKDNSYIAGWCNLSPIDNKPYLFINLTRCTDDVHTMGLVMHETMHLAFLLWYTFKSDIEESMISFAEKEAYDIVELIKIKYDNNRCSKSTKESC